MNISFDLDGTLIPIGNQFSTEKIGWVGSLLRIEKLRKGTKELFLKLEKAGHVINIYTTSFRTKNKIRKTLLYYGISVKKVVNQFENQKVLKSKNIDSSKYPKAFNFDVHIDDLDGVGIEGDIYNFKTIIVSPSDNNWTNTIIHKLDIINKKNAQ